MADNLSGGTTASFNNTPQAKDDYWTFTEDVGSKIKLLDVMSNDLGGKAKMLWSIDDTSDYGSGDLIKQDVVGACEYSELGARIYLTSEGKIAYDTSIFDSLAEGQKAYDQFTYAIRLSNGTLSWATVNITMIGTNDGPDISLLAGDSASEAIAETNGGLSVSGTLTVIDPDKTDTVAVGIASVAVEGSGAAGAPPNSALLSMLKLGAGSGALTADTGSKNNLCWSFSSGNEAFNYLAASEKLVLTYTLTASDGHGGVDSQTVTVTITGSNDGPTAVADTASTDEDHSVTIAVLANDSDPDASDQLSISSASLAEGSLGTVSIVNGQLLYNPGSAYNGLAVGESATVTINYAISDGHGGSSTATATVTVTGSNDGPVITSGGTGSEAENSAISTIVYQAAASDAEGTTLTYSLSGTDAALFNISASGAVTFKASPNFEAPADSGANNVYDVVVNASDGSLSTSKAVAITVTNVNEAPVITSAATASVAENVPTSTVVYQAVASDPEGTVLTYSLSGTDAALFNISASGAVTFKTAPDFEAPGDNGGNNVYDIVVNASDGSLSTSKAVMISVTDLGDQVSNTLISAVADGSQGSNSQLSTVTITFNTNNIHANFTNIASALHVSGPQGATIVGNGTFNAAANSYTFQVDKGSGNNGSKFTLTIDAGAFSDASGNTNAANTKSGLKPAGISGEAINLALEQPADGEMVTVTISHLPDGWTLSDGTQQADGSWIVVTSDVTSLTVTTPAGFAGAMVLDVAMTWTDADGVTHSSFYSDNVEAYAVGNPIFAWSGDDTLTGSAGADLFVFAQPIGADVVHGFDVAADTIDLIGYSGIDSFEALLGHLGSDNDGNALINLADGQSIALIGVSASSLTGANFVFDETPVMANSGTISIGDGALLPVSGTIDNSGLISIGSTGAATVLQLIQYGVTLQGGGQVTLSDNDGNIVTATLPGVTLINVDNVISGAGQIGNGSLTLINGGSIIADGSHALVIDTGSNVIVNTGTIAATGSGGIELASATDNQGSILVNGSQALLGGDVWGSGDVLLIGRASVAFGAAVSSDIVLDGDAVGLISFGDSMDFSGTIAGFNSDDRVQLHDILFGSTVSVSWMASTDGTGSVLTVSDGEHQAVLKFLGEYDASLFTIASDGHGGTQVTYGDWF